MAKPPPAALPLPLPPPPSLIGLTEQPGQDHSFTKIHYYSSPGQIPFEWEAEPGRRKEKERGEEEERPQQVAPLPLNPPPNMHSPAVSRTSSALSDKRVITSNGHLQGKITSTPSQRKDYISRRLRGKSEHKGEADVDSVRSGCNPFCLGRSCHRSGRKLRNR
ncbi:hypothetical protein SUGI_0139710 [Cryptomeria japonica]|nr:hypothetical protein SUGI_0139710 [Cryptomeria japonica]